MVVHQISVWGDRVDIPSPVGEYILEPVPLRSDRLWAGPRFGAAAVGVPTVPIPQEVTILLDRVDDAFAAGEDFAKVPAVPDLYGRRPVAGTIIEAVVAIPHQLAVSSERVD